MRPFSLQINSSEDGVWLHFNDSKGNKASINLPATYDDDRIVDRCVRQFCKDYVSFTANEKHVKTIMEGVVPEC